ncbi:MAG: Na+/H+ antiporter subunit E [Spirochaetaceae bacterium]|nr:Na+/H+ antiporter subunit E [Spirochaetaceae bacterium]MCF7948129.1 Na+/H+ antiporter subunit E [Spirochaetia bacterium]MCF7950777.1 Na+/H+ antiporter subunit E [Spirochaetaceae bacterium]
MTSSFKWAVTRIILTTIYLFAGWLLFTGSTAPRSLLMGAGFSFLIALTTFKLFIDDDEAARRTLLPRVHWLLFYAILVFYKVYVASFQTAFAVLWGKYYPRVVHFRTRLNSDIARSVIAGSITLTPGTITLELTEDHLVVHWLNASTTHSRFAGNIIKGSFEKLLKRVWV